KPLEQAFPTEALRTQIKQPLSVTETTDKFDVLATIAGGGIAGQAGALALGIARALVEYNSELRQRLKKAGFLTRDARIKERKKYGQKGGRKRFQFSKREKIPSTHTPPASRWELATGIWEFFYGGNLSGIALKDLLEAGVH